MTRRIMLRWTLGAALAALAAVAAWWSYHHAQYRYHWREAQKGFTAQDADRARVHLAQCLALHPDDPEATLLAARAARLTGDYEAAEAHLAVCEARTESPGADVQRERALLQIQQGDFRGYMDRLQGSAEGREPPADVLEAMAHGLEATLFFDQAAICLQRLFAMDSEQPRAHLLGGKIFLRKHHAEPALHEFQAALSQLPDALRPRLGVAECLLEIGQVRAAAAHLEALAQRYPDAPDVLLVRARVAVYRAQVDEARKVLHRLLAAHPDHIDALVALGQLEFRKGEPRDALAPLEHARTLHGYKPEVWETLARCHAALGNTADEKHCREEFDRASRALGEVTRLIVRAMQEQPDDVKVRIDVAERYEQLHEPAKAIQWRFCVLHLDPNHAPSQRALVRLFEQTHQPHRAAHWKKVLGPF